MLDGVVRLLAPEGRFCLILPYPQEAAFIQRARETGLFPSRLNRVKGHPGAPVKRSLLEFTREAGPCMEEELTIEEGRHTYTDRYRELTRDFYLKM